MGMLLFCLMKIKRRTQEGGVKCLGAFFCSRKKTGLSGGSAPACAVAAARPSNPLRSRGHTITNDCHAKKHIRAARGIAAEILFYREAVKKIGAESPVFCPRYADKKRAQIL
jgi:hypothetical protein